jgi:LexA DNA binding domain
MPMPAGAHTAEGNLARERVLAFMVQFEKEHGYMPLIDEIASAVGMYRNGIGFHLKRMREDGKIDFVDGKMSRTLRFPHG